MLREEWWGESNVTHCLSSDVGVAVVQAMKKQRHLRAHRPGQPCERLRYRKSRTKIKDTPELVRYLVVLFSWAAGETEAPVATFPQDYQESLGQLTTASRSVAVMSPSAVSQQPQGTQVVATYKKYDGPKVPLVLNQFRFLIADLCQKSVMGMAAMGIARWRYVLKYSLNNPKYLKGNRFVLSNGHTCQFKDTFLAGYNDMTLSR
ncbi:bacterial-like transketolase [Cordyceps militaris]|uniref:Bacterial-like transketolase n=1 Tax=Cordyceps militaris TaxID=73501 RepID=A0A2H4SRF8_CORMI|nr:bacterial-like transketolase [Cordyceps militaris]